MSNSKGKANNPQVESVGTLAAVNSAVLVRLNVAGVTTPATLAVTL